MKTKLNVKLLRTIKAHILEEPRRFFMDSWIVRDDAGQPIKLDGIQRIMPPCGTAACIGGWAVLLSGENRDACDITGLANKASEVLGIPLLDSRLSETGQSLFSIHCWPMKFKERWRSTRSVKTRATIAAERIEEFIRENKG